MLAQYRGFTVRAALDEITGLSGYQAMGIADGLVRQVFGNPGFQIFAVKFLDRKREFATTLPDVF